ncbi:MAG TPA: hypothetical protein VMD31_08320, partial [Opitutaceae bacterium]|nr:hypothetical protein [Opitutaceae bacterium]
MNRREFLRVTGTVGSGMALGLGEVLGAGINPRDRAASAAPGTVSIPNDGWRLWLDRQAAWRRDRIFLPVDVNLAALPVNPPTGGWAALQEAAGREVVLPATVEQFDWGEAGFRPYHDEYKFETSDDEVRNGAYYGVSWWWRNLDLPAAFMGRRILLRVPAARQRAEVYLNERLVGYSILEELPFECELTPAAHSGRNRLAIRITNPGGRLDWVDGDRLDWAGQEFQKSHGFGGLDAGLTVSAHGAVRIADTWVLNTPEPRTITAHAEVENRGDQTQPGRLRFSVLDPASERVLAGAEVPVEAAPGATSAHAVTLTVPDAELWDLATPRLYRLRATWSPGRGDGEADERETDFGFRWFGVDGLGRDAVLRLNGRRVRLYTAISWGYWALNGLFPTPELAPKEVRAAKALGLNCLNFHRNLAKEAVLRVQDREGLLRCLEPGGGAQAVAPRGRAPEFAQRYMAAKITGMLRAYRSHPSVVHYIIQNEGHLDTANPRLPELFAAMRAVDPSRSIVGTDGFVMRGPQAWEEAYADTVRRTERPATPEGGAAGWWVDHSGQATDVWQDGCYVSPRDYYYRSPDRPEIVEWGEMKGPASSDDHAAVLAEIRAHGGVSYDRLDHEQILAAYDAFLDRWGFRTAFPAASDLFRSIGRRAYESWGQFMDNVRISDETDMAAISGWESTAIENHSGLVDNFRNFKSDPRLIAESLTPVRPLAKQRRLTFEAGERAVFDLYLLNDTDRPVEGELTFTLTDPQGRVATREVLPAPAFERDRLSYLLREGFTAAAMPAPGIWRARFELGGRPDVMHERELLVLGPPPAGAKPVAVALVDVPEALADQIRGLPGVAATPLAPEAHADVIVFGGRPAAARGGAGVDA